MKDLYDKFLNLLMTYKKYGLIKVLHRGQRIDFAYRTLNLFPGLNSIDQFAERLFFFGEKSKYFWNESINSSREKLDFEINDISDDYFKYIFYEINTLIMNSKKPVTLKYLQKNHRTTSFFAKTENLGIFLTYLHKLSSTEKMQVRNHYLRILHQLNETGYKNKSLYLSSSSSVDIANFHGKNDIVINFWDLNISKQLLKSWPLQFVGKPYKNQKEISVFTVILPHFIYSFTYKGFTYLNPAIKATKNLEQAIFSGFDIKQESFLEKLKTSTNYRKGVKTDGSNYEELKYPIEPTSNS